jgi:hypothetical protein
VRLTVSNVELQDWRAMKGTVLLDLKRLKGYLRKGNDIGDIC